MSCSHVRPNMALNGDRSFTTENCTFRATGPTWTGNTMLPRDVVEAPLKTDNICPGFSRVNGENPICLITDTCKRSTKLPGSTKICLTSKLLIPNVRMRAYQCGCNMQLKSTGGKGDYSIYQAHASTNQFELDGANPLSYGDGSKQPLPLSFRVVFLINGFTMDVVDHGPRGL